MESIGLIYSAEVALELRHLRYLLAVAERGNFTRAAEDLHVSQPTLSQQVKQLERAVGAQLLDRSGRSVRLTDAGTAYIHYARRVLGDLAAADRAVSDVADLTRGSLCLAVTPTFTAYLVGPLVEQMHSRHPGIDLQVREVPQHRLETGLLADEFDLGIAFDGPHLAGVDATRLFTESLSLVVGVEHPDAGRSAAVPVAALADYRLALLSGGFSTRTHIDAYLAAHQVSPRISVQADSIQALVEIVQRTALITVLPDAIADSHLGLTSVRLEPALPARTVALLRRDGAYSSAATRAFLALAGELIRDRGYPTGGSGGSSRLSRKVAPT